MSAKDVFHDAVKLALQKEGWQVADKQLRVTWEKVELYIDLAAERLLSADRGEKKIAVWLFIMQKGRKLFYGQTRDLSIGD